MVMDISAPSSEDARTAAVPAARRRRAPASDLAAAGEPSLWILGGALAFGIVMVVGFLALVLWNGVVTFYPGRVDVVTLASGERVAGEPFRTERFRVTADQLQGLPETTRARIAANGGMAQRTLYRTGNFDIYNEDFRWVADYQVARIERPADFLFVERSEWGNFIGRLAGVKVDSQPLANDKLTVAGIGEALARAQARWQEIRHIEKDQIGAANHYIERERLRLRRIALDSGVDSPAYKQAAQRAEARIAELQGEYQALAKQAQALRAADARDQVTLVEVGGKDKTIPLSSVVRLYAPNDLDLIGKLGVYFGRWWEFLSAEPREANTEGGVWPAIFGTFAMTLLMVLFVAPFGVMTALYLREYAKQGRLVSIVRISVNNLAGVPSIVYGVFGLGFFAYVLGGNLDQLFFPERLPNPTFGTGGLLWASLTLALLTVPVVIVATEEALSAVPRSMREGSLACGASKWQTIRHIVLPRAMPGIMTGIILAMARGAGEVAPLMLVGVVKLAPELPIDGFFPFVHLERSFMHLGFHIYDVGFQSRNSEAGKPMVFVTTVLLIALIAAMNATAIIVRNRLKRRFAGSQF